MFVNLPSYLLSYFNFIPNSYYFSIKEENQRCNFSDIDRVFIANLQNYVCGSGFQKNITILAFNRNMKKHLSNYLYKPLINIYIFHHF